MVVLFDEWTVRIFDGVEVMAHSGRSYTIHIYLRAPYLSNERIKLTDGVQSISHGQIVPAKKTTFTHLLEQPTGELCELSDGNVTIQSRFNYFGVSFPGCTIRQNDVLKSDKAPEEQAIGRDFFRIGLNVGRQVLGNLKEKGILGSF